MFGLGTLTRVARELRQDLTAAQERDPAAREIGRAEILLTYGGVQALLMHRVAHAIHDIGIPLLPHVLANASRVVTGIEIHPAAEIGALAGRVAELEKLLAEATGKKPEATAEVRPLRNVRGSDPASG